MSGSCATTLLLSAIRLAPPMSEARRLLRSSYVALCTILPSLALLTLYKSVNGSCKLRSHLSANSTLNIQHSTFCMLPVNLDQYSRYVTLDDSELRELNVAEGVLVRLHRLRGMYAYWLQFPSKLDNDLVQYDMAMFKVSRSLAYEDLHLVKVLLGNLQQTTKEFMRWKINKSIEQDIAAARRAGDFRSVASLSKVLVQNNRTDKDDEPELEFDKIIPQNFEPTDDPSVLGIERIPDLRGKIRALYKKYSNTIIQDAEYEEVREEIKTDDDE